MPVVQVLARCEHGVHFHKSKGEVNKWSRTVTANAGALANARLTKDTASGGTNCETARWVGVRHAMANEVCELVVQAKSTPPPRTLQTWA
jgi:hypothetical protein